MEKIILDVCCGSRMFYFQKEHEKVIYMDIREIETTLCDDRVLKVKPDIIGDFRNIPFGNDSFDVVVFDPPHLEKVGSNSWLSLKYGTLGQNWKSDLKQGFNECFRVLKQNGILIFKWNEQQIPLKEILKLTEKAPLLGNKRAKTHWLIFIK